MSEGNQFIFYDLGNRFVLLECQYCEGEGKQPYRYETNTMNAGSIVYKDKPCVVCKGKRWVKAIADTKSHPWNPCNECLDHRGRQPFPSILHKGVIFDESPCVLCKGASIVRRGESRPWVSIIDFGDSLPSDAELKLVKDRRIFERPATGPTLRLKPKHCRHCSFTLPADSTFCSQCGKKLD